MGNLRRSSAVVWVAILGVILLLTVAACSSDDEPGQLDDTPTAATTPAAASTPDSGGSEMRLTANGCSADCAFASDEEFTLAVEIVAKPAGSYIGVQSMIDIGTDLTYDAAAAIEEIVWPDCESAVAVSTVVRSTLVHHGCLSGLIPPLPASTYTGNFVEFSLTCSSGSSETEVRLLPSGDPVARTGGAAFVETDMVTQKVPDLSGLTIICGD